MKQTKIIRSYQARDIPDLYQGERIITGTYVPEYRANGLIHRAYIEYVVEYDIETDLEKENEKLKEEIKGLKEEIEAKEGLIKSLQTSLNQERMNKVVQFR